MHIDQETDSTWTLAIIDIKNKLATEHIEDDSSLLSNYLKKNKTIYYLSDSLLSSFIQLISHEELDCYFSFERSGWTKYYQKYPKSTGFFSFSRPGINALGNKAIIEYCWFCNYLGAMGYLVTLEKINENWIITNRLDMWAA